MKKLVSILLTLAVAVSLLVVPAMVSADGPPTIDGVIETDEWGSVDFIGSNYNVYVLNDADYLYVAFEANCGDYTIASSMTNIYIYAGDDYAGECWAYCVDNAGNLELVHFTTHHIQPPKVKEGREVWSTDAIVNIAATVMEWRMPLAEFTMGLGDPLAFDFMSYSEGCSDWSTAWLYKQEGFTLEANTAVGLTAETSTITAINVDPTDIDFGAVSPGQSVSGPNITVENIGGLAVNVDAELDPLTGTVFNHLKLKGVYSPAYSGQWLPIISSLSPNDSRSLTTELVVPSTYSGKGTETATLIFTATAV